VLLELQGWIRVFAVIVAVWEDQLGSIPFNRLRGMSIFPDPGPIHPILTKMPPKD